MTGTGANDRAEVVTPAWFAGLPVDVVVTTRRGGVSPEPYASLNLGLHVGDDPDLVVENRRRAAAAAGAALDDLVVGEQVHGRHAEVVDDRHRGRGARSDDDAVPATDALVTPTAGPVLVTLVADCVPIVLYDPSAHVLATVHAGWKGTVGRVAAVALDAMAELGADPARVRAGLGPAIGADDYQVGDDVRGAVVDGLGRAADVALRPDPSTRGRWLLDLHAANARVLTAAGVPPHQVERIAASTRTDERFFSHRAAQAGPGPTGRFGLLARLR